MNDKINILIIEDSLNDAELLQYELKKSGLNFSSEIVQTQDEFISALENLKPHIILSDYNLPSFDAVTAFNIKQKKHSDIPFIIVSGTIGEENAVELIKNGVTDYALKDKLFTLNHKIIRALKEAEEKKEKRISEKKLRTQCEKLMEIAFLQSHQARAPIANVLGLINLINFDNPQEPLNFEIIGNLHKTTIMFDKIIRKIVKKTGELKAMQ